MTHSVISLEVVYWILAQDGLDKLIDRRNAPIGKEYGFGIGIEAFDVTIPIVFLGCSV